MLETTSFRILRCISNPILDILLNKNFVPGYNNILYLKKGGASPEPPGLQLCLLEVALFFHLKYSFGIFENWESYWLWKETVAMLYDLP